MSDKVLNKKLDTNDKNKIKDQKSKEPLFAMLSVFTAVALITIITNKSFVMLGAGEMFVCMFFVIISIIKK